MRRLVDGYEPTVVAGSAEWPLHDSCPYDGHGTRRLSQPAVLVYKDDRSGDRDRSLTIPPRREPRNGISYLDQ